MMRNARKVRIYVRNKQRYDPTSKTRDLLYIDVENFVETTIADVKESIRKQTKNAVRIDELFCNNLPLADDRSVAHYNLQDGSILETTSNPFWVACLYIKAAEVKQEQEGNPGNEDIQKWTIKSIPKKYTLIGLLLNSKKEFFKQPPHFPTLDDFVMYLEELNKKGATMHPDYTQRDMRAFEREYRGDFVGKYDDPLSAFLDHHALRLGYLEPEDIDRTGGHLKTQQKGVGVLGRTNNHGRHKQERLCEDCEMAAAVVYCSDCPGGIVLCQACSQLLHSGARRRRHNVQDIKQAPKSQKPYVPRAFLAPFAITVAMYRSLTEGHLSLTEDEIKRKAQPLTDTDLMDKQNGRYVGGFDCMENMLIAKGLVKKEAARVPTFALTESGQILGEKLYTFYTHFNRFLEQHQFPKISASFLNKIAGNRKICLIIDEHERDKDRLLAFASESQIDAQVRFLPAGDYVWILSPPMVNTSEKYTGTDAQNELVLPFVVERKSWEDYENTLNSVRYQRQINNMLGSGLKHCFYLMEGSLSALKSDTSHHHQQHLKAQVGKLTTDYGFYVNYTSSWMKSARWLLWFSQFIIKGYNLGLFREDCISYSDYASRVARQAGGTSPCVAFRTAGKVAHCWTSHLFIDHIFRDSQGERNVLDTVKQDLQVSAGKKHLLVIQDLEQYNKKRQSTLNKCCELVCSNTQNAAEIVSDKIGQTILNMVHYDITSFWQLYVQVIVGVYVVRTESHEDTFRVQQKFLAGPQGPVPDFSASKTKRVIPGKQKVSKHGIERPNNKENVQTLTGNGQVEGTEDIRKRQSTKKSNIVTLSATESSDLGLNNLLTNLAHIQAYKTPKKNFNKPKSSGIIVEHVKPFSGEGHSLGSRNVKTTPTKPMYNMLLKEEEMPVVKGGLMGGALDSREKDTKYAIQRVPLKDEDFVNSQEEKAILQEVIAKSLKEETTVNTEDEMYRLAVELSMKDAAKKSQVTERDDSVPDSEEEQMKLAIERSMNESFGAEPSGLGPYHVDSEKDLKIAIEKSKLDAKCYTERTEIGSDYYLKGTKRKCAFSKESLPAIHTVKSEKELDEEQQYNLALALSTSSVHINQKAMSSDGLTVRENCTLKHQTVGVNNTVNMMDVSEEEQLKMALERSKVENYSPRKRFKSESESRMIDTVLEHRKLPSYPSDNLIVIDLQSQDTDNESQGRLDKDFNSFDSHSEVRVKTQVPIFDKTVTENQQKNDLAGRRDLADIFHCKKDQMKLTAEKNRNGEQSNIILRHTGKSTVFSDKRNGAEVLDYEGDDDCVPPSPDKLSQSVTPISSLDKVKLNLSRKSAENHNHVHHQSCTLSSESIQVNSSDHKPISKRSLCNMSAKNVTEKRTGLKANIFYDSDESLDASSEEEEDVKMKNSAGLVDYHGQRYSDKSEWKNSHVKTGSKIIIPGNLYLTSAKDKSKLFKASDRGNVNRDVVQKCKISTIVTEDDSNSVGLNHRNEVDFDDNLLDIDYQPNSEDLDSDRSSRDEKTENDVMNDSDDECLPVIGRPRSVRYKKMKRETALLLRQKHNPDREISVNRSLSVSVNEKIKCGNHVTNTDNDAHFARILQNELDSEFHLKHNISNTVDDEQIARELQEKLDRRKEGSIQRANNEKDLQNSGKKNCEELDTVYARQLDFVLNGENRVQVDGGLPNVLQGKKAPVQVDLTESVYADMTEPEEVDVMDDGHESVPELQRQELDKIERWRKMILDDEKLAKQLQQLEEMRQTHQENKHEAEVSHSDHLRITSNQDVYFKKMVAIHKASREKALSQLNEYRQLQMRRFQMCKSKVDTEHPLQPGRSLTSIHEHGGTTSSIKDHKVIYVDDEESNKTTVQNLTKTYQNDDVDWQTLLATQPPGQSHFPASSHMIDRYHASQSQVMSGHMNDIEQLPSTLKNSNVPGHMKDDDQSSSTIKNSNITCGNCGEKGHNRTYYKCKKYHTAEETARREAKLEKFRQQKEEKRKMEIETLNLLTNHQQVLEEMTEQIQTEMNTIQRRLKQKTSELEKHVSSRVKKLEKKGKQKR